MGILWVDGKGNTMVQRLWQHGAHYSHSHMADWPRAGSATASIGRVL